MALTKDDIEQAISSSKHPEQIRHSLSNYFEDLEKPVAVAIGVGKHKEGTNRLGYIEYNSSGEDRDGHPQNVDKVVNLLRENGIEAVSFLDPKAASPESIVVTQTGILCPFMKPEDALAAAVKIDEILLDNDYNLSGHVNPLAAENLLYAAKNSIDSQWQSGSDGASHILNIKAMHPKQDEFSELEQKYGGDYKQFTERKIHEAYAGAQAVDLDAVDHKNVYEDGMAYEYRGGPLGANPYAVISQYASRKVAHSSPAISVCAGFCGKGHSKSSRGGADLPPTTDGIEYGFIYKFKSMGDEQQYYRNVGLETGHNPQNSNDVNLGVDQPWNGWTGDIYETPVLPHHNPVESIYLLVGKGSSENKLFEIPTDGKGNIIDPEWRDFLKMHEPSDDKVFGYLAQRQEAQKREQTGNPNHSYNLTFQENLEPDTQTYLHDVSAKEFLRNFTHEGDMIENPDNTLSIQNTHLHFEGLKLNELPDMSKVKIEGRFSLNADTIDSIEASRLPEVSGYVALSGIEVKNVADISAERFVKIISAKDNKGYLSASDVILNCDGMPQDFDKLKFWKLPDGLKMTYDSIEKVPETLQGIGISGVTIKDQSSIESMSAADFIYKINGNMGTHPLGYSIDSLMEQGIHHTEIHDNISLSLQNTNIAALPKEIKDMTLRSIIMNNEAVVTSLDNFPITKEGIYDLNFSGDLKNETMESFLLKTKGTEWVANNTTKAADGHLIINGDFSFQSPAYSDRNTRRTTITSFPIDAKDVEIRGIIEPFEMRQQFSTYQKAMQDKTSKDISLQNCITKLDLSQHQATDLNIYGKSQEIILPPTAQNIFITDSQDFQASNLKNTPNDINVSFYKVNNEKSLDMAEFSSIECLSMNNSKFAEITFPQIVKIINLDGTQLSKPITFPKGVEEFKAVSTNFSDNSIMDLSSCKKIELSNCQLPKNSTLDLSKCSRVDLKNVNLSQVNVILPENGRVMIGENVKFASDFKLDLSKCQEGFVHHSVQCADIKLPQKIIHSDMKDYILPQQVKEISTSCIAQSMVGKMNIPATTKIIDTPDENNKKISLNRLKHRGVSKQQISALRKERILAPFKNVIAKIAPKKEVKTSTLTPKVTTPKKRETDIKVDTKTSEMIAALSGRNGVKQNYSVQVSEPMTPTIEQSAVNSAPAATKTMSAPQMPEKGDITIEPYITSGEQVSNMSKKEKGRFFHNLRMGVNTILAKAEQGISTIKTLANTQTKTNTQQPNIKTITALNDKGIGR